MKNSFKPTRWPIVFRLLLSFVLMGVFCSFVLGFVHVRSATRLIEESLLEQTEESLLRIRYEFDRHYSEPLATHVRLLRDSVPLHTYVTAPDNPQFKRNAELLFLHTLRSSQALYHSFSFVGADERTQLDLRASPQAVIPTAARHALLAALREAPPDSLLLSPPMPHNGGWAVLIGTGYFYPDRSRYSGAVIAHVNLDEIIKILSDTHVAQMPICWTFDASGKLLAAPPSNTVPPELLSPATLSEGAFATRWGSLTVDGQALFQVVLTLPEQAYAGQIDNTVSRTLSVLLLVLLVAIALAIALSRQISRPISQLTRLSKEVAAGDYSLNAPSASGELGLLSDSINHMLSTIRKAHASSAKHEQDLQAVNDQLTFFRDLINQSSDWVVVIEPKTCRLIDVNTRACSALGYTRQEVLAMTFDQFPIAPATHLDWDDLLLRLRRASHIVFTVDFTPDGEEPRKLEVNTRYIPHEDEHYVVAVARDITERLEIEGAYRDSEAYFRDLFDGSPDAIFIESHEGMVLDANPAAAALHDVPLSELIGKHVTELVPPYLREEVRREFPKLATGELTQFEGYSHRKDGVAVPVSIRASRVTRHDTPAILLHVTNISQRKKAEDDLAAAHRELLLTQQQVVQQERLRALGQMASGIAHEFNNALTSILGFSQLLLIDPEALEDSERVKVYLENIQTVSRDAAQIVRRLSDFYRKRKATSSISCAIEIDKLVNEVVELTKPRWEVQAQKSGKQIQIEYKLEAKALISDLEAELRELFTNLIFNASDAISEAGTITITTQSVGEEVIIKVADTGEGMPPEVLARCFEPFYSTKDEKGSGLGMAIVYGVVQRHNGRIEVDSVEGSGSVVSIRLPMAHGEQATPPMEETKVVRGLRILLAEDK
jgi:PAS domain S-box-containing protein